MEIDFRSDTVTRPTEEMRQAMANAVVGDDVMGEDPTVNELEAKSAELTGKEASVFVPSGSMGNLIAVMSHCQRGDELIVGNMAHIFLFEAGGVSALGGVHSHQLPNQPDGTLRLEDVKNAIRSKGNVHFPITKLIAIENTHNRCNGAAIDTPYLEALGEIAKENNLKFHMDGARVFNAAAFLDKPVKEITAPVDSIMFCLSKALSAPVGSMLCGSSEFITKARHIRKQLGGGMRQAGVLAAAGLVAFDQIVPRLKSDMENAILLRDLLLEIEGIEVEPKENVTNMVYFDVSSLNISAAEFSENLKTEYNIKVMPVGPSRIRMVIHHWISTDNIRTAAKSIDELANL